ncbi:MAG: proton-conducting transporter membrane subunit [Terricaulis sp.]
MTLALGSPAGIAAALVQIFAFAAAALALLGGAGAITGSPSLAALDGLSRRAPLASAAIMFGALSLMGAPLTIGFLGRWRLIEAGVGGGWWWTAGTVIFASLAAVFYGGRVIERLYFRRATGAIEQSNDWRRFALAPVLLAAIAGVALALEPSVAARCGRRDTDGRRAMSAEIALFVALGAPVLSAVLVLLLPRPPGLRDVIHIGFALLLAAAALYLVSATANGESARIVLARPLPNVDLAFSIEPLGALVAATIAGLGVLHAIHTAASCAQRRSAPPRD